MRKQYWEVDMIIKLFCCSITSMLSAVLFACLP